MPQTEICSLPATAVAVEYMLWIFLLLFSWEILRSRTEDSWRLHKEIVLQNYVYILCIRAVFIRYHYPLERARLRGIHGANVLDPPFIQVFLLNFKSNRKIACHLLKSRNKQMVIARASFSLVSQVWTVLYLVEHALASASAAVEVIRQRDMLHVVYSKRDRIELQYTVQHFHL